MFGAATVGAAIIAAEPVRGAIAGAADRGDRRDPSGQCGRGRTRRGSGGSGRNRDGRGDPHLGPRGSGDGARKHIGTRRQDMRGFRHPGHHGQRDVARGGDSGAVRDGKSRSPDLRSGRRRRTGARTNPRRHWLSSRYRTCGLDPGRGRGHRRFTGRRHNGFRRFGRGRRLSYDRHAAWPVFAVAVAGAGAASREVAAAGAGATDFAASAFLASAGLTSAGLTSGALDCWALTSGALISGLTFFSGARWRGEGLRAFRIQRGGRRRPSSLRRLRRRLFPILDRVRLRLPRDVARHRLGIG